MDNIIRREIDAWTSATNAYRQNQTVETSIHYVCNMIQIMGCLQHQYPLTKTVLSERVIAEIRGCFLDDDTMSSTHINITIQQFIRMGMQNLESRCILDSWLLECSMSDNHLLAAKRIWLFVHRQLNLSHLHLTTLPDVFAIPRFNYITICNLANNRLSDLPCSFNSLHLLVHLDLSHNQFLTCPNVITSLPRLEALLMDNNLCSSLPSDFARLESAKFLSIMQNPLTRDVQFFANIRSICQSSWRCAIRLSPTMSFIGGKFRKITFEPPCLSIEPSIEDLLSTINRFVEQPEPSIPWGAFETMETITIKTLEKWLKQMICMIHSTPNTAARQQIARGIIAVITPLPSDKNIQRAFLATVYQSPHDTEVRHEHLAATLITLPLIYAMTAIQDAQELVKKYFQCPYILHVLEEIIRQEHSFLTNAIPPQELLSSYLTIIRGHLDFALQHAHNPFPSHEVADHEKSAIIDRVVANINDVDALCSFLARQHLWQDMINQRTSNGFAKLQSKAEWVIRPDASPEAELLYEQYCEPFIIEHTHRILQEIAGTNIIEQLSQILR